MRSIGEDIARMARDWGNALGHAGLMAAAASAACAGAQARDAPAMQAVAVVGHLPDGRAVHRYHLANATGLSVDLLDYGAAMLSISAPDRTGRRADILVHPGSIAGMMASSKRYGRTVGRYAGRLSGGFTIDGRRYSLPSRNGVTLHGGDPGLGRALWHGHPFRTPAATGVEFRLTSPDGAQGFPGRLDLVVRYTLARRENRITIDYRATTSRPTVLNLTNHSYFNLAGGGTVACQSLQVDADRYVQTDDRKLPTGRLPDVAGTPLDFRRPARLGARLASTDPIVASIGGLDHMLALRPGGAARLSDPVSGRTLVLRTDQPGLQVYTANGFDGSEHDAAGRPIVNHDGIALEAGRFPDSPNVSTFPSASLRPGQTYRATTTLRFGVMRDRPPRQTCDEAG